MVRTRTGWLVAVAALGLGIGACKKKDDKAGAAAGSATATGSAAAAAQAVTPDKGAPVTATVSGDDLSLLPANSDVVIGLNFSQLQQSALWKQFAPKLLEMPASGLNDFKTACGFDPLDAVKSISAGIKAIGDSKADGVVVVHGPDKAKVIACLPKAKEEAAKKGNEVSIDGDFFTVKDKHGQQTVWTFANDSTMVGTVGQSASKDAVQAALKGGAALNSSDTFKEMYSKVNTKDSLWFFVNGNAAFMAQAAQAGVKPKAVFGSLNVTDGLTLDMRIRVATAEEATSFVNMAKSQTSSPQVKNFVDKVDITADGTDAKVSVAMSQEKLKQLAGLFGGLAASMLGGAGGMGGGMGGP
jgi:hypothetical protein